MEFKSRLSEEDSQFGERQTNFTLEIDQNSPQFLSNKNNQQNSEQLNLLHPCLENLPKFMRYFISGFFGNFIFFFLNQTAIEIYPFEYQKETVSYVVTYTISIFIQFYLHEWIVFGISKNKLKGIIGCYASYSMGIGLSALINFICVNILQMTHYPAFFITLALTGIFNYFTVSYAMSKNNLQKNLQNDEEKYDSSSSDTGSV